MSAAFHLLLFTHLVGLSIGAGTGLYLGAVSGHAARNLEPSEARTLMPGIAAAISRVGTAGLVLLIASGVAMAWMLGSAALNAAFWWKMVFVAAIVVYVGTMQVLARRVRTAGDAGAARLMKRLAPLGPVLALATIAAAVAAFG